jgi:CRP-like cAMP-binding protein
VARRFGADAQRELCRVMRYRRVTEGEVLVRKGARATCVYILIYGVVHTYKDDPEQLAQWRWAGAINAVLGNAPSADAFSLLKPTDTLHAGEVIGEEELMHDAHQAVHRATVISAGVVELMEIDRHEVRLCALPALSCM